MNPSPDLQSRLSGNLCPIHQLPPELLVQIMQLVKLDEYGELITRPLRALAQLIGVCKRWKSLIEDSPVLWTHISSIERPSEILRAMHYSKTAALDIIWHCGYGALSGPEAFLEVAQASAGRWRTVAWSGNDLGQAASYGTLINTPMPILESLRINLQGISNVESSDQMALFAGSSVHPTLVSLRILYAPIALAPLTMPNLKELFLFEVPTAKSTDVARILASATELGEVALWSLGDRSTLPATGEMVVLPRLREVTFHNIPSTFARFFLSKFIAPKVQALEITCCKDEDPLEEILLPNIPQLIGIFKAAAQTSSHIDIVPLHGYTDCVSLGEISISSSITDEGARVDPDPVHRAIAWMRSHVGNLPVRLFMTDFQTPEYLRAFRHEMNITAFNLDEGNSREMGREVIALLAGPISTNPPQWILPAMTVFNHELVAKEMADDVIEMVRNRNAAALLGGQASTRSGTAPNALREVHVSRLSTAFCNEVVEPDVEYMDALVDAAGGADVFWKGVKWDHEEEMRCDI